MVQILNGDCYQFLAALEEGSVDLIYADPPYKVGKFKPGTGGSVNNIMNLDKTLQAVNEITETNYDLLKFCKLAVRAMKEINIYIWCNKKQIKDYFNFFVNEHDCTFDILTWYKTNALPTYSNKYLDDCEYCLYFRKGAGKCFPKCYDDAKKLFISPINRENKIYGHPNIKPLQFVKAHISNSSKPGDTIVDPFSGSGTAAVATKELYGEDGVEFVGIELNKTFYEQSLKRLNGDIQPQTKGQAVKNNLF